jgi:L-asparaginase II
MVWTMTNPILVEVTRGDRVESSHRGAVAIVDGTGAIRAALGDIEAPVYPRSALKPIQALALTESGAADAFGLDDEHIALACASHSGELMHTARVAAWLKRLGLSESDLACGPHAVRYEPEWRAMIARGDQPTRIHNNCSGKHAGFLTVAQHWGIATRGYEQIEHPVQQMVLATLHELSGVLQISWGVDGCAVPNFVLPLSGFALALAKFASPDGLALPRATAMNRIVSAMTHYPELVSGTGRTCSILMRSCRGRAAVKTGAEGVYAAVVPALGLGVAVKIDDGAGRAAETVIASVLHSLRVLGSDEAATTLLKSPITNTRGAIIGERKPTPALADLRIR